MRRLPIDAIHPNLEETHNKLVRIAEDRPGLLGEFPVLSVYLFAIADLLKTKDIMLAHDFFGNASLLIKYAIGEGQELGREMPIFNKNVASMDPVNASSEGGDVLWLMAMRIGVGEIDISKKLNSGETQFVVGMMGIISGLKIMYPDFKPDENVAAVSLKNNLNYPSRVLRAEPSASIETMAKMFELERLDMLKDFRSRLHDRKITQPIHAAIEGADKRLPSVPEVLRGAHVRYKDVLVHAREAANYYAY